MKIDKDSSLDSWTGHILMQDFRMTDLKTGGEFTKINWWDAVSLIIMHWCHVLEYLWLKNGFFSRKDYVYL